MWGEGRVGLKYLLNALAFLVCPPSPVKLLKQWEKNKADRFGKNHFWLADFRRMGDFKTTALFLRGWIGSEHFFSPFFHPKGEDFILLQVQVQSEEKKISY